eukprot:9473160-Pyramimonas_sp.AAC.3
MTHAARSSPPPCQGSPRCRKTGMMPMVNTNGDKGGIPGVNDARHVHPPHARDSRVVARQLQTRLKVFAPGSVTQTSPYGQPPLPVV